MNVDEAWESFIKNHQIKKSSIDEKLDMIASQMNELQTDVSRLAENIPEMQGDAAAMEAANAAAGPDMGAPPGLEQLGAALGGEEMPPEGAGAPPMEEGAEEMAPGAPEALVEGEPMEEGMMDEEETGGFSDEELDELLNLGRADPLDENPMSRRDLPPEGMPIEEGPLEGMAPEEMAPEEMAPAMGETDADMISKIKELIMNEEDPSKLAALSELLTMAANSGNAPVDEDMIMEQYGLENDPVFGNMMGEEAGLPIGKSDTFKKTDTTSDTPEEGKDLAESSVSPAMEEAPEVMVSTTKSYSPSDDLMSKIMEAIMPILEEFSGNKEAAPAELPLDGEAAPKVDIEAVIEDPMDGDMESDDALVMIEGSESDEKGSEEDDDSEKEDDESEKKEESDEEEPEDELSDDTEHFEASDCIKKSFRDIMSQRMSYKVGIDGSFAKTPAYLRKMTDGHQNVRADWPHATSSGDGTEGKHIATYQEMNTLLKSDRAGHVASVNGEIMRPDPLSFKKSDDSGMVGVPFETLMNAPNPHELMEKEWKDYNLFKSQY